MWFFFSPKIIYGEDAIDYIEHIAGKKCFIVTDKIIEDLGFLKILTDKLKEYNKEWTVFNEVEPDPKEESIIKGKEKCLEYEPDIIFGLGGGSVMDVAKSIWAIYEYPQYDLDSFYPFNEDLYNLGNKAKMVAIPTTSGTGAETTWAVVISRYEDDVWKKYEQAHKGLIPMYAIVDPIFPAGMPPKLTIATGFDALAHSLEAVVSKWRNEFSDAMCLKAVEMIFQFLPLAEKNGDNMEARDKMHQAATMAGLGFGNSQAHLGHTMGHVWGALFHVTHGICVGICLPYITQFCLNDTDENNETREILSKFAKQLGWAKWDENDMRAAEIVIEKVKELQKQVGFPTTLAETGVSREQMDQNMETLINLCFQSSSSVMSPRSANAEAFKKFLIFLYEYFTN
ncbi:MAG: iron-containing alcohol dehydrogenase [Candidatus Lokiarchaeota archaeon]